MTAVTGSGLTASRPPPVHRWTETWPAAESPLAGPPEYSPPER